MVNYVPATAVIHKTLVKNKLRQQKGGQSKHEKVEDIFSSNKLTEN